MSARITHLVALGLLCCACRQDMHDQPKLEAYEGSAFFADGRAMQRRVPGTVARGDVVEGEHLLTGKIDGELADALPFELTREVLERGRERYAVFCTPCHDAAGTGGGMIVLRGMKRPETFHSQRLKEAPLGHWFDVMTRGFGAMYDYSDRIPPRDRWAIAAWVRVLQRASDARLADVPSAERARLEQQP